MWFLDCFGFANVFSNTLLGWFFKIQTISDEPSAQLYPASRRQLIELLRSLPLTQLIATHDLDMALELCSVTIFPRTSFLLQSSILSARSRV